MDEYLKYTYPLRLRVTGEELRALACMAQDDLRDLQTEAYFSLRKTLIDRGYLADVANSTAVSAA